MIDLPRRDQFIALAPIGVCAYITGFSIPFYFDIPLIALAATSVISAPIRSRPHDSPLVSPLVIFLIATSLSILTSQDVGRSLRLSLSWLPALLIYFLIVECFYLRHLRMLYVTFSLLALGLAGTLLWIASNNLGGGADIWMETMGSPILLVPNDITFLAILFPFSLALLCQKTSILIKMIAVLAIFLSILAVLLLHSRIALLTLIVTVACMAAAIRPRFGVAVGIAATIVVLLVDGLQGFPLLAKHGSLWDTRIPLWLAAWQMFLDAPFLGHGPHTFVLFYQAYLHNLTLPNWLPVDPRLIPWTHNLYLETLAEQGMLGLGGLLLLLYNAVSSAWRTLRVSEGETRFVAASVFASLIGFCIAASFELSLLRQWVVVMLFILLGVIARFSDQIKRGDTNEVNQSE